MPTSAWREQIHQAKWCYLLLFKVDVDKQQIQRHHQRWPARMLGQEQHQECRTDYRRGLPDGIHVAGDRPGMRSIAKDDWGDPTKYGFLLIGRSEGLLQLYFIPVFIYTFIKVKSKWGKKRDGCAMAKWFRPFSLLAAKCMCAPGAIKAEQNTSSTRRNISTIGTRKYPWIHTRFYSPFGRNKPRHALSLQTGSVGARKGCFCLFSLCSERVDEKKR